MTHPSPERTQSEARREAERVFAEITASRRPEPEVVVLDSAAGVRKRRGR